MQSFVTLKKVAARNSHSIPTAGTTWQNQPPSVRQVLRGPALQPKLTIGVPDDAYEREADRVADRVMRLSDAEVRTSPAPTGSTQRLSRRESDTTLSSVAAMTQPASTDCNPFDDEGYPLLKRGARRNAVGVAQTQLNRVLAEIAACFPDPGCIGGLPLKNQNFIRKHIGMLSKNPIDVDCQFGPDTLHATYAAQAFYFKREGEWDGIIGPNTWYPLDYPLAPKP